MRKIPGTFVVIALVAACGADSADQGTNVPPTMPAEESTTTTEDRDMDLLDAATADLATRIAVPETEIEVLAEESVTWPDGSLGCPEPGKSYTQALVEGGRIVLGYGEKVFVYHYGDSTQPFLCKNPDSRDGSYEFIPPPGGDVEK